MICPICSKEMVEENFGVNVDVCKNGCKGIWFDQGELRMLDENNEGLGAALEEALRFPRSNDGKREKIKCPKCSIPMQIHRYKHAQEINVDECYNCGGFFLDSGELVEIRENFMSQAQVEAYTDQLLKSIPQYTQAVKDLEAKKKRIESVQHYTKFMSVNYWRKKFQ